LKITRQGDGSSVLIEYDDLQDRGTVHLSFDLVVLSDGIHAGIENSRIAEVYRLAQDKDGFLKSADIDSGIFVCGTATAPMKIDEAYADAVSVAGRIIQVTNNK
jgi:heterodisulfide reductase subunit A-like polyferredoxin